MAVADSAVLTETDGAEDSADDWTARKLLPGHGECHLADANEADLLPVLQQLWVIAKDWMLTVMKRRFCLNQRYALL